MNILRPRNGKQASTVALSAPSRALHALPLSTLPTLLMLMFSLVYLEGFLSERVFGATARSYSAGVGGPPMNLGLRFVTEFLLAAALGWTILQKRKQSLPPGTVFFVAYALWSIISSMANGMGPYQGFLYSRYTFYSLAVYFIGWNCPLRRPQVLTLIRLVKALFILQIVSSIVMLLLLRQEVEWRVGTMSTVGGELATVFPLLALGFAMGWYFFVRPRFSVLLLGIGFGLVGLSSGKRAIFFLLPLFFAINFALYFWIRRELSVKPLHTRIARHACAICLIGALALPLGLETTQGFDEIFARSGLSWQTAVDALHFIQGYNSEVRLNGSAVGRNAASAAVLVGVVTQGSHFLLFGWGPEAIALDNADGSISGAAFSPLGLYYGIVGWSRDAISVGLIGVLFYVLAYLSVLRTSFRALRGNTLDGYGNLLAFGAVSGVIVILVNYFLYASGFMECGVITYAVTFAAGIVSSPRQQLFRCP